MKKVAIAVVVLLVILGGAAVAGLPMAERYFAGNIKEQIDQDGVFSVGTVEVGLLERRITMRDIKPKQGVGMAAARWEASGLSWPLGEILKGHTPLFGIRLGDPLRAGRVEADGVEVGTGIGQNWRFSKIVGEGVDLERFSADIPPGPMQQTLLLARLFEALSIGQLEERDAIYVDPFTKNTIGFLSFNMERFEHGRIGAFTLASFEATSKSAAEPSFRMGALKGEGLDLRQIVKTMSQPSWRPGQPVGRLVIDKASATGFGGELLTRYGLSLGSISVEVKHESPDVARSTSRIDGFVMDPPSRGVEGLQARMVMAAMGLKDLRLALECSGSEDRAKGEVVVDRCALIGPDLGELALTLKMINADAAFWRAMDGGNALQIYASKVAFSAATLSLADKGLLERSLKALAAATGRTPAVARASVAADIRHFQPPNVLITDELTKLLDTVAGFVEKGGTLTLDAKPDPPLGLLALGGLAKPGPDLVGILGLTAKVTK
jgi:hypothetical protein